MCRKHVQQHVSAASPIVRLKVISDIHHMSDRLYKPHARQPSHIFSSQAQICPKRFEFAEIIRVDPRLFTLEFELVPGSTIIRVRIRSVPQTLMPTLAHTPAPVPLARLPSETSAPTSLPSPTPSFAPTTFKMSATDHALDLAAYFGKTGQVPLLGKIPAREGSFGSQT